MKKKKKTGQLSSSINFPTIYSHSDTNSNDVDEEIKFPKRSSSLSMAIIDDTIISEHNKISTSIISHDLSFDDSKM